MSLVKILSTAVALSVLGLAAVTAASCSRTTQAAAPDAGPNYPSTLSGNAPCGSCLEPANLSWKTIVTSPKEPGDQLVISGRILQADGTPAEGFVLFIYHTDASGYYNEKDDASHPRLMGWMKTGTDGRYRFRTIRPAPYPHRTTPAHIHAHVYGPQYSERPIADYWFEGDPLITAEELARVAKQGEPPAIVSLKLDGDLLWQGRRDITLKPNPK